MDTKDYREFLASHPMPWCWWCGRGLENRPLGWGSPWLIERAHIFNNPRRNDRRAVVLLCSWCHKLQHGEQLVLPGVRVASIAPTPANMMWLKKEFDRPWYDREFLATCKIGRLPIAQRPLLEVLENHRSRREWIRA